MPNARVTITETRTAPNYTVQIQVSPDPISLKGQGNGAVVIQWDIDPGSTQGWSFGTSGIDIKNPAGHFTHGGAGNGNKRYTWTRDAHGADGKPYRYTINVTNGTATMSLDPIIGNDM